MTVTNHYNTDVPFPGLKKLLRNVQLQKNSQHNIAIMSYGTIMQSNKAISINLFNSAVKYCSLPGHIIYMNIIIYKIWKNPGS